MVARIISGKNIKGLLHYNEEKVVNEKAVLILANGFAQNIDKMTVHQKYERFARLIELRPRVKTNALHISLNFDPSENPNQRLLQQVAMSYMQKIGFDEQPFLVYRHKDAGHPHIHIVTTLIRSNGKRIDIHNIGKSRSEPARKAIEQEFKLLPAGGIKRNRQRSLIELKPLLYGQTATKEGISQVVRAVFNSYHFNSLAEFNAILKLYNVQAHRGEPDSIMYKQGGLKYTALNNEGNPIGVPIKASALPGKPTLKALEKRFEKNKVKPKRLKEDLKFRIAGVLHRTASLSTTTFTEELRGRGIDVLFRTNESGFTYGITFVDHKNRIVFNGSQLGKELSAKAILARFEDDNGLRGAGKAAGSSLRHSDQKEARKKRLATPGKNRPLRPVNAPGRIFTEDTLDPPPPVPSRKRRRKRSGMHL